MWVVIARPEQPDVPYWPGRRWVAALDAVLWPLLWIAGAAHWAPQLKLFAPMVIAWAVFSLISRLHRAWVNNERYRMTTWRWGRVLGAVWLTGVILRLFLVP